MASAVPWPSTAEIEEIHVVAFVTALLVLAPTVARGQDTDRIRFYLGLRGQDTNPQAGVHDAWGASIGANLGKYWGLELSADTFERRVERGGGPSLGEYGVLALVPQLRLRYPLFGDRLVPYVIGGVGLGLTSFNDRKPAAFGVSIQNKDSSTLVGTVGGGLEYFIADNIAVGVEVKYVLAEDQTLRIARAYRLCRERGSSGRDRGRLSAARGQTDLTGGPGRGRPRGAPEAIVILRAIATTTRGDNEDFTQELPRELLPMKAKEPQNL